MDSRTLLEAVDDAFATTGAGTPPWPDPHKGMEGPRDEEYSRCLNWGKYRILKARADAWVLALTRLGLAVVEEIEEPGQVWRDQPRTPATTVPTTSSGRSTSTCCRS